MIDKTMRIFRKKESYSKIEYDKERQIPVIKCSICNGEKVAGFKDKQTGHFIDVMLIKTEKDIDIFKDTYGLDSITKEY